MPDPWALAYRTVRVQSLELLREPMGACVMGQDSSVSGNLAGLRRRVVFLGGRRGLALLALAGAAGVVPAAAQPAAESPAAVFARVVPDDCHGPTAADFAAVQAALTALEQSGDRAGQIRALILLATLEQETGDNQASLPYLQRGLTLAQQPGDEKERVRLLALAGVALKETDWQTAEKDLTESSNLAKGDAGAQAFALTYQAEIEANSDASKAVADLAKALDQARNAGDKKTQAIILTDQAEIESLNPENADEATAMFEKASKFADGIHDCREQAANLSNWAAFNVDAGQESEAFQRYQQALAMEKETGDQSMEAPTLHALGTFYEQMGDLDAALANFKLSLAMEEKLGNLREKGQTMAAIAGIERDAGNAKGALDDYQLALQVLGPENNVGWEITALNNMGTCEADLKQADAAQKDYLASIALARQHGDRVTPAYSAWGLGELDDTHAVEQYSSALRLAREGVQVDLEGMVDASLMDHFRQQKMPGAAIFFGKRAVDQFQSIRRQMGGLADEILSSFLQKKASAYRELAGLLMDEGRLVEAQQVLDLLKIQQYADYLRKEPGSAGLKLARTPAEQRLEARYDQLFAAMLAADEAAEKAQGAGGTAAPTTAETTPAQDQSRKNFSQFVEQMETQLATPARAAEVPVTGAELSLEKVMAAHPGTVALYTLLGEDSLRILVITAKGRVVRTSPTAPAVIEGDCTQFIGLLDKDGDSQGTAAALYDAILGPVESDLNGVHAKTLVWSLDGTLRYIPMAALYDAKTQTYAVDEYTMVNFTPLGRALEDAPQLGGASGIAMGVTQQYDQRLPPLPSVTQEVESVVNDRNFQGSDGVLPGTILLDEHFTRAAMEEKVKGQAVIHIASHFVLFPGNDALSFLLLGGQNQDSAGYLFPMSDLASDEKIGIAGAKLMTLSACQTGAENKRSDDGVVMESLGELALDRGAEAAISSLWDVTDESTGDLMGEFYALWVKGKMTKAAALHQAEFDLRHGKFEPSAELKAKGVKDFSNPHFWAPFVLAGNWQ